jgi:hypothetical protein
VVMSQGRGSPESVGALAPDVVCLVGGHVHVQVAHVGLLGVGLQTASQPVGLGAAQEGVGDEDEPWEQEGVGLSPTSQQHNNSLMRKKSMVQHE